MIKRVVTLVIVLAFSIESFAAVVGDNDGAAFITKAEFDSLKSTFQAQIDRYNSSIANKIDGAIASYLNGISSSASYLYNGNNSLLSFPLTYEKQNSKLKRIIDNGGVYNEALIKFGADLWMTADRGDLGSSHFLRKPTGEAITGYVGNYAGNDNCMITGQYNLGRLDLTGMMNVSFSRGNSKASTDKSVLKGRIDLDYTPGKSRVLWAGADWNTTRIVGSSTSNYTYATDNTLFMNVFENSASYTGDYTNVNYYGYMSQEGKSKETVMGTLDYCNPSSTWKVNFNETPVGTGLSWASQLTYQNTINIWKDSIGINTNKISIVAQGNMYSDVDSETPSLHFVVSKKHRQPYFADDCQTVSQHYWESGKGGTIIPTNYHPEAHIFLIDFGPMLRLPNVETDNSKKNLFYNEKLIAQNIFQNEKVNTNMNGGLPIYRVYEKKIFKDTGSIEINISKGRMARLEKPYLFISNKPIYGDTKDDIINNTANHLFSFNGEKCAEVVYDTDQEYKFDFEDDLVQNDILYLKLAWPASNNDESLIINNNPQLRLNT